MNRIEQLLHSPQISVLRFDHQQDCVHDDPTEEVCQNYGIHFVEAGSFKLSTQKKSWVLSSGAVFISQPGAEHRYSHEEARPSDVCTSVVYSHQFVAETSKDNNLLPSELPTVLAPTNHLAFLKFRLSKLAGTANSLALEGWACELIAALRREHSREDKLFRTRQLGWYAERVDAARELLETRYAESLSLASLGQMVGIILLALADSCGF